MALSEQERRMLEEIESALIAEDPRLAEQSRSGGGGGTFNLDIRSVAVMLVGLVALIGGIALAQNSLWFVALSVVGFLVMFGGGLMAFRGTGGSSGRGKPSAGSGGGRKASSRQGGIQDRMEQSFRRRFEQ